MSPRTQIEQAYADGFASKCAALNIAPTLLAGLGGAAAGGIGGALIQRGNWKKRLRNALAGATIVGGAGAALGYGLGSPKPKGAPEAVAKVVAPDGIATPGISELLTESEKNPAPLRRETPSIAELVPATDTTSVDRAAARVAAADKALAARRAAQEQADAARRLAEGHAVRRARFARERAAAEAQRVRRLEAEAIARDTDKRDGYLDSLPWLKRKLIETMSGVPAGNSPKQPFKWWELAGAKDPALREHKENRYVSTR